MRVDRYLVVASSLPETEDWMLVDCLYRQIISASDDKKSLERQAKERTKADDKPLTQRHKR